MPEPVSDEQFRMLARFRASLRRFLHFSEEAARAAGLTPQQHQALLALRGQDEPMTIGQIALELAVRPHSAVGLVDRLAANGLVERFRSESDRRQVRVRLTTEGQSALASLAAAHRAELRRVGPELAELLAVLGREP
ncbi:MAG TPA: MarR family transcriptional regulator [Thermoanaerobaculia bacterium]|jgi:DNA-binding MarR family transcriptional regulator|nr:MarR family transcriptional regulator [Thermoanaerobaculia bacterium]